MEKSEMIRYADIQDLPVLKENDKHISEAELKNSIAAKRILIMHQGDAFMGWLRFESFWDNIPLRNGSTCPGRGRAETAAKPEKSLRRSGARLPLPASAGGA